MQERLGIRRCPKSGTPRLQLATQLWIVVDLSIEHHYQPAIFADHGLRRAFRQIQDRQPPMRKTATAIHAPPGARAIRPPRPHGLASGQELGHLRRTVGRMIGEYAVQPTHETPITTRPPSRRKGLTCSAPYSRNIAANRK